MPKYLFKANNNVISHCHCDDQPASWPGQADCPWCGCGWMISCSRCRKSFVFAEVREIDTSLEVLARADLERFGVANVSPRIVNSWVHFMTEALQDLEVGATVVYLDGRYLPVASKPVRFVGNYALHNLPRLPHADALTRPERLSELLGDPQYWIDRKRPEIVIVAGPNGAGKTTFANAYLPLELERFVYINADEIARDLQDRTLNRRSVDMEAGREMLTRIDQTAASGLHMMFETTLATRTYAQKIKLWQAAGYVVKLFYLRLPSAEHAINRVQRRVEFGGHSVPSDIVRRRYAKSERYLDLYKSLADEWYVWDSLEGEFSPHATWLDDEEEA